MNKKFFTFQVKQKNGVETFATINLDFLVSTRLILGDTKPIMVVYLNYEQEYEVPVLNNDGEPKLVKGKPITRLLKGLMQYEIVEKNDMIRLQELCDPSFVEVIEKAFTETEK